LNWFLFVTILSEIFLGLALLRVRLIGKILLLLLLMLLLWLVLVLLSLIAILRFDRLILPEISILIMVIKRREVFFIGLNDSWIGEYILRSLRLLLTILRMSSHDRCYKVIHILIGFGVFAIIVLFLWVVVVLFLWVVVVLLF
jgi:hypothetical protein